MPTTLEWFGTATFRVRDAGLDLFFDAYLDRLPGLEPVGLSTAEVDRADFVFVSHAHSQHDGGQLAYLLTTARGSVLVSGSAGYWRGIFSGLRPDLALLSLGGRPNVDGEPFQGSSVQFMLEQVQLLRPGRVAFCHHDPLFPELPGVDIAPAAAALVDETAGGYRALEYATPIPLFD